MIEGKRSQLSLRRIPSGPAISVHLREVLTYSEMTEKQNAGPTNHDRLIRVSVARKLTVIRHAYHALSEFSQYHTLIVISIKSHSCWPHSQATLSFTVNYLSVINNETKKYIHIKIAFELSVEFLYSSLLCHIKTSKALTKP